SGSFEIPPPSQPYHKTLTHTSDVGKGCEFEEDKLREWFEAYERMSSRYNGRRARLGLERWGGGHTFYINNQTKVEGLASIHSLIDDPDVRTVFVVPHKHKQFDDMHISVLV
ncbi:MAG: hypothetical protein ACKPKO_00900, partial [Candidatus Fonsibacter sp.]